MYSLRRVFSGFHFIVELQKQTETIISWFTSIINIFRETSGLNTYKFRRCLVLWSSYWCHVALPRLLQRVNNRYKICSPLTIFKFLHSNLRSRCVHGDTSFCGSGSRVRAWFRAVWTRTILSLVELLKLKILRSTFTKTFILFKTHGRPFHITSQRHHPVA